MKKAKIMLVAIAVLATVGGALAFKAAKFGVHKYCYLTTNSQPPKGQCTAFTVNALMQPRNIGGSQTYFYITTEDVELCEDAICTTSAATTILQ
jgi:hypothetical protein